MEKGSPKWVQGYQARSIHANNSQTAISHNNLQMLLARCTALNSMGASIFQIQHSI